MTTWSKKPARNRTTQDQEGAVTTVKILDSFGLIDFDPTYDYKAEHNRKR